MDSSSRIILPPKLLCTVKLALEAYRNKALWEKLMIRGMAMDFSWEQSARAYVKVYEDILTKKRLSVASTMNSFEILSKVIEISNAPVDVDRAAEESGGYAGPLLFRAPLRPLSLGPPAGPAFFKITSKKHPALSADLSFSLDEGPLGTCAPQKVPMICSPMPCSFPCSALPFRKPYLNFVLSLVSPSSTTSILYGVLTLLGEEPRQLSEEERDIFPVICRQIAGTPAGQPGFAPGQEANRRIDHPPCHRDTISSTLDLGELLHRITLTSAKILQADGSLLHFLDEEAGMMKVVSSYGVEEGQSSLAPLALGEEMAGTVALTGEPIVLQRPQKLPPLFSGAAQEDPLPWFAFPSSPSPKRSGPSLSSASVKTAAKRRSSTKKTKTFSSPWLPRWR